MIQPTVRTTPKPQYKDTVVCKHCRAEYKPGNWYRGRSEGTTGRFRATSKIDNNLCPVCGLKNEV